MPRTWPKDHPGRTCNACGRCAYPLWIDDSPPPGTCSDSAPTPKACRAVMEGFSVGFRIARANGEEMHPDHLARMQRTGVTMDDVKAYVGRFEGMQALEDSFQFDGANTNLGEIIRHFLRQSDDTGLAEHDRALVLIKFIADEIAFADGERTVAEIQGLGAWFRAQTLEALTDIDNYDLE